ncbi:MAG: class I SAM-dependent methyltransferase [Cyanobacteria bacterium SID2]|nr:class I SAM-dependent methyltransferase [Cyanobacteria bacterium SID2]MBP0005482.1 class I SAM-dependent methyltransferase [Cyanobacteria bacterium SBC]
MNCSPLSQIQKRLFAWGMSKANEADDRTLQSIGHPHFLNLAQLKQSLLGKLRGRVLEIGPGAGANFKYYHPEIEWVGIEPNPFMYPHLEAEAQRYGLTQVRIETGTAEHLQVEENSIDAVVSTHVLCSVRDLDRALDEIERVLKPNGRFVFLEHVAACSGTWTRHVQNGVAPLWTNLFDRCHPNRETAAAIDRSRFTEIQYHDFQLSFPIVSPHIAGFAVKGGG